MVLALAGLIGRFTGGHFELLILVEQASSLPEFDLITVLC
jgi:hypothetical protein